MPGNSTFLTRYKWDIFLFVFCQLLYANSVFNQYNMDDELVTIQHRLTSRGIAAIPDIFTSSYYEDASGYSYEYRPVVLATFALEHEIAGDNPHVSHLVSLLLYATCVVLLYRMLALLVPGYSRRLWFFIALLFAVHPAHTEVVCSIKNRDEILALLFGLLTVYAAICATSVRRRWYVLVPVFFLLALLSKKTVMPLVLIIPCALALGREMRLRQVLYIGLLLAIPVFGLLTYTVFYRAVLLGLIVCAIFLFYLLVQPGYFMVQLSRFRAYYRSETAGASPFRDQQDLRGFLGAAVRDMGIHFSWIHLVVVAFCLAVFAGGLWYHYMPAVFVVLVVFTAGIWGNKVINWWATLGIYICLSACMFLYEPSNSVYSDLLYILLVYQMLYSRGRLFIPSLLLYIVMAGGGSWYSYLNMGVIALVLYRWPRTRPLSYVAMAAGVYDSVKLVLRTGLLTPASLHTTAYSIYIAAVFLLPQMLHKSDRMVRHVIKAVAIVVLMVYTWPGLQTNTARLASALNAQVDTNVGGLNKVIAVREQNRELNYVEQPVPADAPWSVKAGTDMEVLLHYLHKVVLPYPMAYYYGYRFIYPQRLSEAGPLMGLVCYILLTVAMLYCIRRYRLIALGLLVFLASIAAVSGAFIPIPGMVAERYLLLPSLGWCIALVAGLAYAVAPRVLISRPDTASIPPGYKYAIGGMVLFYGVITITRNAQWSDAVTLMRHDISYVNSSAQAHSLLAVKLMKASYETTDAAEQHNMHLEAYGHLLQALAIYPRFYNVAYDLGRVNMTLHRPDSSIYYFQMAQRMDSSNSDPSLFTGEILMQQGKYAEAIPPLEFVVMHGANSYEAYSQLSLALYAIGSKGASIAVNKNAVKRWPALPDPYINIAKVYVTESKQDSALLYLHEAQRVAPGNKEAADMIKSISTGAKVP